MSNTPNLLTIKGFIQGIPKSIGKKNSMKVSLVAQDGTEYPILHKGAGVDLIDYVSADVELTASIEEISEGARKVLRVRKYQVMDDYDDLWYDNED